MAHVAPIKVVNLPYQYCFDWPFIMQRGKLDVILLIKLPHRVDGAKKRRTTTITLPSESVMVDLPVDTTHCLCVQP